MNLVHKNQKTLDFGDRLELMSVDEAEFHLSRFGLKKCAGCGEVWRKCVEYFPRLKNRKFSDLCRMCFHVVPEVVKAKKKKKQKVVSIASINIAVRGRLEPDLVLADVEHWT
jgi:hypothetical protein